MLRKQTNNFNLHARKVNALTSRLPRDAHSKFVKETPIDTGNAKRKTRFTNTIDGGTITGDYNYANRLNEGYSRQATKGMTQPTIQFIRNTIRRALR